MKSILSVFLKLPKKKTAAKIQEIFLFVFAYFYERMYTMFVQFLTCEHLNISSGQMREEIRPHKKIHNDSKDMKQ